MRFSYNNKVKIDTDVITKELLEKYDNCIDALKNYIKIKYPNVGLYILSRHHLSCCDNLEIQYHKLVKSNFSIIYIECPAFRKKIITEMCAKLDLEFIENDYKKLYLRLKIKNIDLLYTISKLLV